MKDLLAFVGLVVLVVIGWAILDRDKGNPTMAGNIPSLLQTVPNLEHISSRYDEHLIADTDYYDTFRNEGASGKVLLDVCYGTHQEWKRTMYFDRGEQREIHYTLPGLELQGSDNKMQLTWKPVSTASADELKGAMDAQ